MTRTRKTDRAARRLFRLCLANGRLDEDRVRQAVRRIAGSSRRGVLPVLTAFQRLVRLDRDRHTARIESASALPPRVREAIQADLARLYGPDVRASFQENPALIAGMRIRIGSDVYDGSVRARLAALGARL